MIQTLQKKFVITAMTAITVLIFLMLGAINIANIIIVGNEVERTLHIISENEGNAGNPVPPGGEPGAAPPALFMRTPKNEYDTLLSSNFFIVRFDQSGTIVDADTSRTSSVTEEEAAQLASEAYAGGDTIGRAGKFRYLMRTERNGNGTIIVFLDASGESVSYLRVLLLSAMIGLACWGLMLLFVILLSKKAIRPIAESLEKQKQFVTNAGHEIKTPLAIIQSNAEAMELYQGESKWSRNIKEQTLRLSGLMKNLLMLARMDEGGGHAAAVDFSMSDLVEETKNSFMQPMESKCIALQSCIAPNILLHAEKEQIEQLLCILLENAVKYTDTQGTIWIRLQRQEKTVELAIENTCSSLPPVPPDKLFDRFYRGDAARTQKSGGYGIGLSVARAIVSANGGTLHAVYQQDPVRICFQACFKVPAK